MNSLPFTVNYSQNNNRQINCVDNINVIPNGPVFPSQPIFPSSLPPSMNQYPSNMQTNFINVKREANISNLRSTNLIVDSGSNNKTLVQFKNLPLLDNLDNKNNYYSLIVDSSGKLYRKNLLINNQSVFAKNINGNIETNNPEFSSNYSNSDLNNLVDRLDDI